MIAPKMFRIFLSTMTLFTSSFTVSCLSLLTVILQTRSPPLHWGRHDSPSILLRGKGKKRSFELIIQLCPHLTILKSNNKQNTIKPATAGAALFRACSGTSLQPCEALLIKCGKGECRGQEELNTRLRPAFKQRDTDKQHFHSKFH